MRGDKFFQGDCFLKNSVGTSQAAHLNMGLECNVNITSFISVLHGSIDAKCNSCTFSMFLISI